MTTKTKNLIFLLSFIVIGLSLYKPISDGQGNLIPLQDIKATTGQIEPLELKIEQVSKTTRVTCYNDFGTMSNGDITYIGAVAVSDRSIPLNSEIYVEGYGVMTVADRTAKWIWEQRGMTIDIYSPDCNKNFGVKKLTYKLL